MRTLAATLAVLLCALAAPADARKINPRPPAPAPEPAPAKPAKPAPPNPSIWAPLVRGGSRFVLRAEGGEVRIEVEVYDARTVKGAQVARLRWTVVDGQKRSPMGNSLPTQIAVSKKGAYLLTDRMDDAGVARAIAGKPTYLDPPKAVANDDGYVRKDGDLTCIGIGTPPGHGECPAGVCHAEYCLAPGEGLVSLSGNHTPGAIAFTAPRRSPGALSAGPTGIPECDTMVQLMLTCAPQLDPAMGQSIEDAARNMIEAFRQAAITPDTAAQIAQMCRENAQTLRESLAQLGCKL